MRKLLLIALIGSIGLFTGCTKESKVIEDTNVAVEEATNITEDEAVSTIYNLNDIDNWFKYSRDEIAGELAYLTCTIDRVGENKATAYYYYDEQEIPILLSGSGLTVNSGDEIIITKGMIMPLFYEDPMPAILVFDYEIK